MEVIPEVISSAELEKRVGGKVTCPLCRAQSTSDAADIGWVALPELQRAPRWICLGSWIDVSSIARADEPAEHPYYDDLRRLATLAATSPADLIQSLLHRQLSILQANPRTPDDAELAALESKIEALIGQVHQ